jgi:hypothetical protein
MSVEGPERFTGGCLCSVRIVASGRPYRVGVCLPLGETTEKGLYVSPTLLPLGEGNH